MADPVIHSTAIGHHCSEAITAFAIELGGIHNIDVDESAQSLDRMSAVLDRFKKDAGQTTYDLLDALFYYWRAAVKLANRQAHGAEKSEALTSDDARRVVFDAIFIMCRSTRPSLHHSSAVYRCHPSAWPSLATDSAPGDPSGCR